MKKNIKKIVFTCVLLFLVSGNIASAALLKNDSGSDGNMTDKFRDAAGFEENVSIGSIVATTIKAALSLLGIIFLILLVMAGFKYMTAQGEEEKVKEALATIRRAIIGIIIVLSAYAITSFVFSRLDMATGGTGGAETGGVTTGS